MRSAKCSAERLFRNAENLSSEVAAKNVIEKEVRDKWEGQRGWPSGAGGDAGNRPAQGHGGQRPGLRGHGPRHLGGVAGGQERGHERGGGRPPKSAALGLRAVEQVDQRASAIDDVRFDSLDHFVVDEVGGQRHPASVTNLDRLDR